MHDSAVNEKCDQNVNKKKKNTTERKDFSLADVVGSSIFREIIMAISSRGEPIIYIYCISSASIVFVTRIMVSIV